MRDANTAEKRAAGHQRKDMRSGGVRSMFSLKCWGQPALWQVVQAWTVVDLQTAVGL